MYYFFFYRLSPYNHLLVITFFQRPQYFTTISNFLCLLYHVFTVQIMIVVYSMCLITFHQPIDNRWIQIYQKVNWLKYFLYQGFELHNIILCNYDQMTHSNLWACMCVFSINFLWWNLTKYRKKVEVRL